MRECSRVVPGKFRLNIGKSFLMGLVGQTLERAAQGCTGAPILGGVQERGGHGNKGRGSVTEFCWSG